MTKDNGKEFKIHIPEDSRTTFGPWSPPSSKERDYGNNRALSGTLRVYQGKSKTSENIIAVFSGVASFRDVTHIEYEEKVAEQVGATMWQSDRTGYKRTERVVNADSWTTPQLDGDDGDGEGNGKLPDAKELIPDF